MKHTKKQETWSIKNNKKVAETVTEETDIRLTRKNLKQVSYLCSKS